MLICEGYLFRNSSVEGRLTLSSDLRITWSQSDCAEDFAECARQASFNCVRIFSAGLRDESGLWSTREIFLPLRSRISFSRKFNRSEPSKTIEPSSLTFLRSSNANTANANVLFPEPLWPIRP